MMNFSEGDVIRDVEIFKRNVDVYHHKGGFKTDEEFVKKLQKSWTALTADGYRPPLLVEHNRNGGIYGRIIKLNTTADAITIDIETAEGIKKEFEEGFRSNLSPTIYLNYQHPHTGEELEMVLVEVSMVSVPHLKNLVIPPLYYSMSDTGFVKAEHTQEKKMDEELKTLLDAMMARIEALEEAQTAENAEDEEDEDAAEMAELRTRLSVFEMKERVPGVEDAEALELAELRKNAPGLFEKTIKRLTESAPNQAKIENEIGSLGGVESGELSFSEAKALAKKNEIAPGPATLGWIAENHPTALKN